MSSTNKTSLGLNMWEASDKPVRQDFVNDNVIIDEKITKLNSDLVLKANASDLTNTNSNLTAHKTSTDHDSRYYTKAQIDAMLEQMAVMYYVNNNVVIADAKTKQIYQTMNLQTNRLITDANGWVNTYDLTTVKVP
ncbi:hypothetical protein [Lacrimispora saccharolytica]|uniref:hypothetical protein n=1 Tax=Lacrimispora saccharolytica TaxID=84030 RepID=UPI001959BBBA|nr:hypothetical protein [Lacrimispora saccharolytica]QRV19996.1 hypothetical protein I6K70_00015 [Lacrimispora saccharolytica]